MHENNKLIELVIFCKTYRNDFVFVSRLCESIKRNNIDNIPFYVSIPRCDYTLFNQTFNTFNLHILFDEDILDCTTNEYKNLEHGGYFQQQVVKMSFALMNIAQNYIVIDSDCFFTKPFQKEDFLYNGIPYTTIGEVRIFFEQLHHPKKISIENEYHTISNNIKKYLQNEHSKQYGYGPTPVVWASEVLLALHRFAKRNNDTFTTLIKFAPYELNWYGEALLKFFPSKVIPCSAYFKCYHYENEYFLDALKKDITSSYYSGIVLQSTWLRHYPCLLSTATNKISFFCIFLIISQKMTHITIRMYHYFKKNTKIILKHGAKLYHGSK